MVLLIDVSYTSREIKSYTTYVSYVCYCDDFWHLTHGVYYGKVYVIRMSVNKHTIHHQNGYTLLYSDVHADTFPCKFVLPRTHGNKYNKKWHILKGRYSFKSDNVQRPKVYALTPVYRNHFAFTRCTVYVVPFLKKWIYCTSDKAKLNNTYIVRINVFNVYGAALTRKYLQTRNTYVTIKKEK